MLVDRGGELGVAFRGLRPGNGHIDPDGSEAGPYGGVEAEKLLLGDDPSWGCAQDLLHATEMIRDLVEVYGMGEVTGVGRYRHADGQCRQSHDHRHEPE